ncbi:multiple epidermal growth factor-like domains protein 11 [Mya arenaria]|uniref:multiple epidermal growth factor-like domains protein 11 n=1 Tax=Mya arenaria TaxID=6604 RepID=UPI0022E5FFA1|nr:multiple epidermal growth factor-like domains protein 11 [Mya arenaria]
MTDSVCKIGSSSACTNNQNDCVSNSACASNTCTCTATTHSEETSTKLCKKALGQSCTATSDCENNISPVVCDTTLASPVCKIGVGGACGVVTDKCTTNSACDGGSSLCACSANYPALGTLCVGELTQSCVNDAGCISNAGCVSSACACSSGYVATGNTACKGDYGTACSVASPCDTATNTLAVCDNTGFCKIKAGSSCAGNTDKCVSGASCDGGTSNCACNSGYTQDATPALCLGDAGTTCTASTDCDQVTVALVCDLTVSSPVCRKKLTDCGADTTNCVANNACSGGTCNCATGFSEDGTTFLCEGGVDSTCDNQYDCDANTGIVCDTSSSKCKKDVAASCSANQCITNAECASCSLCACLDSYTYASTTFTCDYNKATSTCFVSAVLLMICLLVSLF